MPDPFWSRILSYVETEWHVIRRAPLALCILACFVAGVTWFGASQYYANLYEGTLRELTASRDTTEQRRAYAQDQIMELQHQLRALGQQPHLYATRETYTIRKEDEMGFVQAWRTIERISDVEIAYVDGNEKAEALAKRLSDLFELCSWTVGEWDTQHVPNDRPPGVTIWAKKDTSFPASAGLLKALLTKHNIEARLRALSPEEKLRDPWGSLKIFIGPDPQDTEK